MASGFYVMPLPVVMSGMNWLSLIEEGFCWCNCAGTMFCGDFGFPPGLQKSLKLKESLNTELLNIHRLAPVFGCAI